MTPLRIIASIVVVLLVASIVVYLSGILEPEEIPAPKLWKELDLTETIGDKGLYPSFGDLDNDGEMDVLLHRVGSNGEVAYMTAVTFEGKVLWQLGDSTLKEHEYWGHEPPNRALAIVYDIDHDDRSEVIAEIYRDGSYNLEILDGENGEVLKSIASPFAGMPELIETRAHPMAFIAYMDGADSLPTLVVKYEASNHVNGLAVGFDKELNEKWRYQNTEHSMGHIPDISDIDNDGKEEVLLGFAMIDDDGSLMWETDIPDLYDSHADMVTAADVLPNPGKEIMIAECHREGKAYCFSVEGELLWKNSRNCDHTECIWVGNFIDERPGTELIIQNRGHRAIFMSAEAKTGKKIRSIQFSKDYTDWPIQVNWNDIDIQSMWMPLERKLYDGYGKVIQDLGPFDEIVLKGTNAGVTKEQLGVQAFALDVCGDDRQELVLYQPFHGEKIYIFTQPDSDGREKEYVQQKLAYNMRTIH